MAMLGFVNQLCREATMTSQVLHVRWEVNRSAGPHWFMWLYVGDKAQQDERSMPRWTKVLTHRGMDARLEDIAKAAYEMAKENGWDPSFVIVQSAVLKGVMLVVDREEIYDADGKTPDHWLYMDLGAFS